MQFWRGAEGNNLMFLELLLSLFCRCEVNEKWMVGGSVQLGNLARRPERGRYPLVLLACLTQFLLEGYGKLAEIPVMTRNEI